jgi:hypothetical protein
LPGASLFAQLDPGLPLVFSPGEKFQGSRRLSRLSPPEGSHRISSTLRESETLDRPVGAWAELIARWSCGSTVQAVVTHAEYVHNALNSLSRHERKARQLLAQLTGLSRSMMSKLATIGRRTHELRRRARTLPPWLYPLSPAGPARKLMTILVPPGLQEAARCPLIPDIEAALMRVGESRRVGLDTSLPASRRQSTAHDTGNAPEPQTEHARQTEQGPMGDTGHGVGDTGRRPVGSPEPEARLRAYEGWRRRLRMRYPMRSPVLMPWVAARASRAPGSVPCPNLFDPVVCGEKTGKPDPVRECGTAALT